jgi:hypothetical protein
MKYSGDSEVLAFDNSVMTPVLMNMAANMDVQMTFNSCPFNWYPILLTMIETISLRKLLNKTVRNGFRLVKNQMRFFSNP